jgi:phospholipid/cholesterol/gamma-HCH transport system permease protein
VLNIERAPDRSVTVTVGGRWRMREGVPAVEPVLGDLRSSPPAAVIIRADRLEEWDASVLSAVSQIGETSRAVGASVDPSGLPAGLRRLLDMTARAPIRPTPGPPPRKTILEWIGYAALDAHEFPLQVLGFIGDVTTAFGRLIAGRAHMRRQDFFLAVQMCGANALPIVGLVAFLVGLILAFVGAVELQRFGTEIYVANLVGVAMVREMGAMMSAIVVAGRTGAAFAAEIGTMRVTQEVDALTTVGISPIEFLVLPRILALSLMLPLLTLYADILGILGGAAVGLGMLGIQPALYVKQTVIAVTFTHLWGGLAKAFVYGALVAGAGCLQGLRTGSSAAAVGHATTSAVVTSIVLIISACGLFAVVFYILGI